MPPLPTSKYITPCSRANSRMSFACSAEGMSLLGTKWSGTITTLFGSKTLFTPMRSNSLMAMGAVMSLAITRSTLTFKNSPGLTLSFPLWAARILSDMVDPVILHLFSWEASAR